MDHLMPDVIEKFLSRNRCDLSGEPYYRLEFINKLKSEMGEDSYNSYLDSQSELYNDDDIKNFELNGQDCLYLYFYDNEKLDTLNRYLAYLESEFISQIHNKLISVEIKYNLLVNSIFEKIEILISKDCKLEKEKLTRIVDFYTLLDRKNRYDMIYSFRWYQYNKHLTFFHPNKCLYQERCELYKKKLSQEEKNRTKRLALSDVLENKSSYLLLTNHLLVLKKIIQEMKTDESLDMKYKNNLKMNIMKEKLIEVVSVLTNEKLQFYILNMVEKLNRNELKVVVKSWNVVELMKGKTLKGTNEQIRKKLKKYILEQKNKRNSNRKTSRIFPKEVVQKILEFSDFGYGTQNTLKYSKLL